MCDPLRATRAFAHGNFGLRVGTSFLADVNTGMPQKNWSAGYRGTFGMCTAELVSFSTWNLFSQVHYHLQALHRGNGWSSTAALGEGLLCLLSFSHDWWISELGVLNTRSIV
jgi:hypothetical protein